MKKLFSALLLFAAVASPAIAQEAPQLPCDPETKLITYSEVVPVAGVSKNDLYKRGMTWFKKYYKNPADVIREKDSVNSNITGVHRFDIIKTDPKGAKTKAGMVQYTLRVMAKDGKYKYEISQFNWKQQSHYPAEKWMDKKSGYYDPAFEQYLQQTDAFAKKLIEDLKKGMLETGEKKEKDW